MHVCEMKDTAWSAFVSNPDGQIFSLFYYQTYKYSRSSTLKARQQSHLGYKLGGWEMKDTGNNYLSYLLKTTKCTHFQ